MDLSLIDLCSNNVGWREHADEEDTRLSAHFIHSHSQRAGADAGCDEDFLVKCLPKSPQMTENGPKPLLTPTRKTRRKPASIRRQNPVANARTPRLRGRHSTPPSYTTFVYRTGSLGATPGVLSLFESMAISIPGATHGNHRWQAGGGKGHM